MGFLAQDECRCCQKFAKTGDAWHCEECWNAHHNGLRDHDWLDKKEFEAKHKRFFDFDKMLNEMMQKRNY